MMKMLVGLIVKAVLDWGFNKSKQVYSKWKKSKEILKKLRKGKTNEVEKIINPGSTSKPSDLPGVQHFNKKEFERIMEGKLPHDNSDSDDPRKKEADKI